jgi:hypothetical protein
MKWAKLGAAGPVLLRPKIAVIAVSLYLLVLVCAWLYPLFDHRTFAGLVVVILAWPWIDYFPSAALPLAVLLNTIIIYAFLAVPSLVPALLRRFRK